MTEEETKIAHELEEKKKLAEASSEASPEEGAEVPVEEAKEEEVAA
jgi:hypothetical protein